MYCWDSHATHCYTMKLIVTHSYSFSFKGSQVVDVGRLSFFAKHVCCRITALTITHGEIKWCRSKLHGHCFHLYKKLINPLQFHNAIQNIHLTNSLGKKKTICHIYTNEIIRLIIYTLNPTKI